MIDVHAILMRLAGKRPVFHSEADFQHALAWELHRELPEARIRLEYRPFSHESVYIDIWIEHDGKATAIELKYLTRKLEAVVLGEAFSLRNQAAQDVSRYHVIRDIVRIERVASELPGASGVAVILTNDTGYWKESVRETIDAHFRLHEGRALTGALGWSDKAGPGTIKGIAGPLTLANTYALSWREYSSVAAGPAGQFRYLLLTAPSQVALDS